MTRVVHLRSGQGLYGAERSLLALASATQPPLRPVVVSLLRPGREDALGDAARQMGLEAVRIDAPGKLSWRALGPVVRLAQGALLHAHDYKALWIALAARIRAVAPRAPIHVIPNGIAIGRLPTDAERRTARETLGIPDRAQVVAFVGRLSPEKGPEVLLGAARGSGLLVLVAGDGPLRGVLEAEGAGRALRFLGFVPDVGQVLAAADLLALPSRTEGLPMAVLEAMAAGVPVVASAVGSLPEVLGDGAGVLVPPGDVEALRDALVRLADPGPRHALALAARARVESRYGAAGMARSYLEQLYQPALESARGRDRAPAFQPR